MYRLAMYFNEDWFKKAVEAPLGRGSEGTCGSCHGGTGEGAPQGQGDIQHWRQSMEPMSTRALGPNQAQHINLSPSPLLSGHPVVGPMPPVCPGKLSAGKLSALASHPMLCHAEPCCAQAQPPVKTLRQLEGSLEMTTPLLELLERQEAGVEDPALPQHLRNFRVRCASCGAYGPAA